MGSQRAGHDWVSKQQWVKSCTILSCDGLGLPLWRASVVSFGFIPVEASVKIYFLLGAKSCFTACIFHDFCSFICWWMWVAFLSLAVVMMLLWRWVCKCLLILLSIWTAGSCGSSVLYFFAETTMLFFFL